jgi:hypothetical protein
VATAVEDAAWFDDQTRGVDFAGDDALGLNFDSALGEDYSVKPPGNDYLIPFDLAFDFGTFTEDERLITEDVALDLSFNAERAGELQSALKAHGSVKEAGPFALGFRQTPMI